jgi:hypothetical protein
MAVLDAHKILEIVLSSKGYPGNLKRKLFLAGYSLGAKDPLTDAIKKQEEISTHFDFQLSSFEAEEIARAYKKVIDEVTKRPAFTGADRIKSYLNLYFSPKSLPFWRNISIVVGFFVLVKILAETTFGKNFLELLVNVTNFILSLQFVAILLVIVLIYFGIIYFLSNKSKVKIKEEE